MENDFLNEGMDFLSKGKESGRVFSFKDFVKESLNETGEADQDYDHEVFDKIVAQLDAAGYPNSTHREFDKYQGVYIFVPNVGKFWNTDIEGDNYIFQKEGDETNAEAIVFVEGDDVDAGELVSLVKDGKVLKEEEMLSAAPATDDAPPIEKKPETPKRDVGYGDQPFFFAKNGDTGLYFFKVGARGLVLNIGKFSKFAQPTEPKMNYGVLTMVELPMDALDQAVLDNGKFDSNNNKIDMSPAEFTKVFNQVAICVSDYLQKNPSTVKFYDELQGNITIQDYDNKFALSMQKWPGGTDSWKLQVVEQGKLNTIQK